MAEEVAIDLNIKTGEAEKNTQSLKAKLKQLKQELAGLDEGSAAFNKIAAEAGKVQDKIGDLNKRVNNLASDTRKLDVVVGVAQGIAGGFAAAQGAAALFGAESEDLNKALLKVQGSVALLNGVQQIANTLNKDSAVMTSLNSAAQTAYTYVVGTSTGALRVFKLALAGTGIGLIVIAIGALIANWDKLTNSIRSSSLGAEDAKKKHDALNTSLEGYDNLLSRIIKKLKGEGASEETIFSAQAQAIQDKINVIKNANAGLLENIETTNRKIDAEAKRKMKLDESYYISEEELSAKKKTLNEEAVKLIQQNNLKINDLELDLTVMKRDAEEKRTKDAKKLQEEKNSAELKSTTEQNEKIKKIKDAANEADMEDVRKKDAARQANIEAMKAADIQLAEEDLALKKSYDEQDLERRKALALAVTGLRAADVEEAKLTQAEIDAAKKKSVEDAFSLTQQSLKATQGLSDIFFQNQLNQNAGNDKKLREIKKKQFETNKIFTVSSIVLDTIMGMMKAIATSPPPSPVGIAGAVITGIAGTAATIKALAAKFDGGAQGSFSPPSSTVPSGGGQPNNFAPSIPTTPSSIPIPQQVYVTETDITGTQSQVQVIEGLSKFQ